MADQGQGAGQGGPASEWAQGQARALRRRLCQGRDPLLMARRMYPDPTAEIDTVLARALDAARAEEREQCAIIAEINPSDDDPYWDGEESIQTWIARVIRARGEEAGR